MDKQQSSLSKQSINKVVKMHDDDLRSMDESITQKLSTVNTGIAEAEALLSELGYDVPDKTPIPVNSATEDTNPIVMEGWDSIAARAENRYPGLVSIEDVFTKEELSENHAYILGIQNLGLLTNPRLVKKGGTA
jgi:hypothetical protein